jgi:DNA-binding response OmpR family regulator
MTNQDRSTILVVEADSAMRDFLAGHLTADGFSVETASCAEDALEQLGSLFPDLAIVDVELPDHSGLDLLAHVRGCDGVASRVDPAVPVVALVPTADELDCVRAFERGADDVLAKPLSYRELRCRVSAVLRRTERPRGAGRLRVAGLEIDTASRTVHLAGTRLDLSAKEFALLRVLAAEPTRVFTKAELLRAIWGQRTVGTTRTLDSHACRLRRKLGATGERFIVNVWGVGYRLVDAPAVMPGNLALVA